MPSSEQFTSGLARFLIRNYLSVDDPLVLRLQSGIMSHQDAVLAARDAFMPAPMLSLKQASKSD